MAKWDKPKLTILARNKPEEAVLEACKTATGGGPMQALYPREDSNYCFTDYAPEYCATDAAS